jgi:MinD-like ATPase involved in chromosome partitioning or flagellar assembly
VAQRAAGLSIDELAQYFRLSEHAGRRIAIVGAARNVGTTRTAIALARLLSRSGGVVLVDLALAAPNIEIISREPGRAGIADLVRGTASFGEIISRDQFSRLHLVTAGRMEGEPHDVIASPTLAAAVDALAQSYDYLVIDGGIQSEGSGRLAPMAPRAVLVGGDATADAVQALSDRLRSQGFIDVTVLTGPVPQLDYAASRSAAA